MNVSSCRRQRGGAKGWLLFLIVVAVAAYIWRDSITQGVQNSMTPSENQNTSRACGRQFANALIDQDEAAVRRVCKPGRETQAFQVLGQFKAIVDSGGMSEPDKTKFRVNVGGAPGQGHPGKQITAKIVLIGVNNDPGANLVLVMEMQDSKQWQVIDASITAIER